MFTQRLTYETLGRDWDRLLRDLLSVDQVLILDFSNIEHVDSSFLAFLLALLRATRDRHGVLKIKHMTADIQSLMQVQGIWPLFKELIY